MGHPGMLMQEGISEVIATTRMNAAPIGIICRNSILSIAVFRTSHTAANLLSENWIVANISSDPVLFVRTAFDDLPESEFCSEQVGGITVHRLAGADSWAAYRAEIINQTDQKILAQLTPIKEIATPVFPRPVNRGRNSIIEAAVHGTRYILTHDAELRGLILHHMALAKRCGGEREHEALDLLHAYLDL